MERAGKLLADALLGQGHLRCKPAQLKCPSFQLGMTLFQLSMTLFELSMTSADGLLRLLLLCLLSFFIAAVGGRSVTSSSSPVNRITCPSASRWACPRLCIHDTLPLGCTIRNVQSNVSCVFVCMSRSTTSSTSWRSSSCTRLSQVSNEEG